MFDYPQTDAGIADIGSVDPALVALLATGATLIAFLAALMVTRVAQPGRLLDLPGRRRSHARATPRAGGAGIALVAVLAPWVAYHLQWLGFEGYIGMLGSALLIALCGAWDDLAELGAGQKLLLQALAVTWLLAWLAQSIPALQHGPLSWGWWGYPLTALGLIWMTNLFNFMDGSDGLAASQAILTLTPLGLLALYGGYSAAGIQALLLAAAAFGFLPWNWPRARVFMGDVSSLSLGWGCALVALQLTSSGISIVPLILLFGLFFFDASITLLNRMAGGRRWYTAHREHAYQALLRSGLSHLRVLLLAIALHLCLYLPAAWLAFRYPQWQWFLLGVVAILSLVWWCWARRRFLRAVGRARR